MQSTVSLNPLAREMYLVIRAKRFFNAKLSFPLDFFSAKSFRPKLCCGLYVEQVVK